MRHAPGFPRFLAAALLFSVALAAVPAEARGAGKTDFDVSGAEGIAVDGSRRLASFEEDSYGPLPFPEQVWRFIDDETFLLLERQKDDGSFEMLGGRTTEAGGTVDGITLASISGYSLRNHVEANPEKIERAISKTLAYVVHMVRSGKLRNGRDAAWRYAYSLRFLVHEYPHLKDAKTKALIEDACVFLIDGLEDLQQGTIGQKSEPVDWRFRVSPGIVVEDDAETGKARVAECPEGSPARKAGIRPGDILVAANGDDVHTTLRYYLAQMHWKGGETIHLQVMRKGKPVSCEIALPSRFPGTVGFTCRDGDGGKVIVDAFGPLGDFFAGSIAKGDRILKVGGKPVPNTAAFNRLTWLSGQTVVVERERGGKSKSVEITCAPAKPASFGVVIGAGLDQTTIPGLAVQKLAKNSCLGKAGIRPGDRILRIDDTRVMNRRHFLKIEKELWGGQPISVTYLDAKTKRKTTIKVKAATRSYGNWLKGYHGITISNAGVKGAAILRIDPGSPADVAGCAPGDVITEINGETVATPRMGLRILSAMLAGQKARLAVERKGRKIDLEFLVHRRSDSPWISNSIDHGGGWAYYTHVRGGTTFLTSDVLRELIRARKALPFRIREEMIRRPFDFLSKLRAKQPNSQVESYRYDGGGSFWGARDIRADVGRLCSAELACLMYCDSGLPVEKGMARTQAQLAKTLEAWLRYRGILEYARSEGHQKFSIAPWYLPYSYMTTLEAAEYLVGNDELKERVRRTALKAYFKYAWIQHIDDLGGEGWQIGYYKKKQLFRSGLLLDGLATMKPLYQPKIGIRDPALRDAKAKFDASDYGEAYALVLSAKNSGKVSDADATLLMKTIGDRFDARLAEIEKIHKVYYLDAIRYFEEMKSHFVGYPRWPEAEKRLSEWKAAVPEPINKKQRQ